MKVNLQLCEFNNIINLKGLEIIIHHKIYANTTTDFL